MSIPFAFGRGCIGRTYLKMTVAQLKQRLVEIEELARGERCAYGAIHYFIDHATIDCVIKHKEKRK